MLLPDVNYSIYIYNSESGQYVLRSDVVIGTTNQYTADNSKRYKLFYLKQSL